MGNNNYICLFNGFSCFGFGINMNRLVSDTISGLQRIAYKISPRSAWSEGYFNVENKKVIDKH